MKGWMLGSREARAVFLQRVYPVTNLPRGSQANFSSLIGYD